MAAALRRPASKRHSLRDLLKVLRLAAAQQPPKFHKVKGTFPVGTGVAGGTG